MQNGSLRNMGLAAVALAIVGLLLGGTWFVAQPKITVVAPAGSTITARLASDPTATTTEKVSGNSASIRVGSGYYEVIVDGNGTKQLFYGNAGVFQDTKFTFNAPAPLHTSLAARQVAYNVVHSGNTLAYLDTTIRVIKRIDQNGTEAGLDTTKDLAGLDDSNTGDAQGLYPIAGNKAVVLSNGRLYKLDGNRLAKLNTHGMPGDRNTIVVGSNPAQSSFAVSVGQTVYWYDSLSAAPQKLAKLSKRFDQLVVGGKTVLAYSTRMPDSVENIKDSYNTTYAIDPILVNVGNKTPKDWGIGPIVDASISPDGTYATILTQHANSTDIYKLAGSSLLYEIESPDTTTPTWADASHFVYGKGSDVWKFDVENKTGVAISTLPASLEPTSIVYDSSDKGYYITSYDSLLGAAIYHAGPIAASQDAQRTATLALQAQTNSTFAFSYINISQPTLRITTIVSLNNPSLEQFRAATLQARQAALRYAQQNGVHTSTLRIQYNPANL